MKIRNAKLRAAYYDGEEILDFNPPYIGVNKFISQIRHNGKRLHPEFIPENYWDKRKESWQTPLETGEDISKRFSDDEIEIFFNSASEIHLLNDDESK